MPTIDPTTFNDLKQMSGDDFINELIDTFLEDAPQMIADLNSALANDDAVAFRRAAHSLKSNALTFGAGELAELAKELETFGRENKLIESRSKLKALEEACAFACEALRGLKS